MSRTDESFAARLRRLRLQRGLTVEQLAIAAGTFAHIIRSLEQGMPRSADFVLGIALANRLAVDPIYLAVGEEYRVETRITRLEVRVGELERMVFWR